jgi:hypothetical protein
MVLVTINRRAREPDMRFESNFARVWIMTKLQSRIFLAGADVDAFDFGHASRMSPALRGDQKRTDSSGQGFYYENSHVRRSWQF